jgi:(p)ppGpp synthase/HD superfamily hydrolase
MTASVSEKLKELRQCSAGTVSDRCLARAKRIARVAHLGQFRANGEAPYLLHPVRVSIQATGYLKTTSQPNRTEDVILASLLHDVIEDGSDTIRRCLVRAMSTNVVFLVEALTKANDPNLSCVECEARYYRQLHQAAGENPQVAVIKLFDVLDNLNEIVSLAALSQERAVRYLNTVQYRTLPFVRRYCEPDLHDLLARALKTARHELVNASLTK